MQHKLLILLTALIMAASLFAGCGKDDTGATVTPLPVATANPDITHPEGRYYAVGGELKAEGGLVTLGSDFMRVMIEGEEVEFALSEKAQREISIYNKDEDNLRIMRGTMLLITYTERDLIKIAETMDILQAN